jgi:hypothetical protein
MFIRCETWLLDMQETNWVDREWGRTANYVVNISPRRPGEENVVPPPPPALQQLAVIVPPVVVQPVQIHQDVQMAAIDDGEDDEMMEAMDNGTLGDLEQFQWP